MTYSRRSREFAAACVCALIASCGGPAAPETPTEAQVIVVGAATWQGYFGIENAPHEGGNGTSAIFLIGTGRQCAVVTKHGSSDRTRPSKLTLRVAERSESTSVSEFSEVLSVCGTGPLR